MEESGLDHESYPIPPASLHFAPFYLSLPPSLSTQFNPPCQPIQSSRQYAYLSLHPRGLFQDEAFACDLFTPIHSFLIAAVIGFSLAESKKDNVIRQLQKTVDLRDQVLSSMQLKLDDLCQQLNLVKDQSGTESKVSDHDDLQSKFGSERLKFNKAPTNLVIDAEPEERRMSDMSDWCSSLTSVAEFHFDNLSLDQDMLSLREECQEKDATIKDLTSFLHSTNKRETELEEIIRRKKTTIKKLKKDVLVLEEKVTQLTRLGRSSYPATISDTREFSMKLDNLLYDMDLSTTCSSSDSETPANKPRRRAVLEDAPVVSMKEEPTTSEQTHKSSTSLLKSVKPTSVVSPYQKPVASSSSSSRMRRASLTGDSKKTRRPIQTVPRESFGLHKRWV